MPIFRKLPLFRACLAPLTLATLLTAGCSSAKSDQLVVIPAGNRENGMLVFTQTDHNRTAEIRIGDRIAVRLPANPATGFNWAIDETDSRLLVPEGTDYAGPSEPGIVGARGQQSFTFTARSAGEVALKFKYWRFWDGDASITERCVITLKIRE